jgi:hypothetical protein
MEGTFCIHCEKFIRRENVYMSNLCRAVYKYHVDPITGEKYPVFQKCTSINHGHCWRYTSETHPVRFSWFAKCMRFWFRNFSLSSTHV